MRAPLVGSMVATAVLVAAMGGPASAQTAPPPSPCGPDWTLVDSPNPGTIYSDLLDVAAVDNDNAWAVGFRAYLDRDGQFANSPIIERWDGSAWTVAYRPGLKGQLAGVLAFSPDDVWAVGHTGMESIDFQPLIMHWDGEVWTEVESPAAAMGYLTAIGGSGPHDLWAAGTLIGTFETIIEHWNGTAWTLVDHPSPSSDYVALGGIAADGADDVWVVGTFLHHHARNAPLALHWNGVAWRRSDPQGAGRLGTSLTDVAVTPGHRVIAVGNYVTDPDGTTHPVAETRRKHEWVETFPIAGPGSWSFASITTGPEGVWAVGSQRLPDEAPATLTERWRPRLVGWHVVASPNAAGEDYLLGVDEAPDGELWAVGFHRTGEQEKTLIIHRCP